MAFHVGSSSINAHLVDCADRPCLPAARSPLVHVSSVIQQRSTTTSTMTGSRRPPLILTGGPAAGKTTTGRALAHSRPKAAFIDVDDIRQLVVTGAATAWEGREGQQQMHLAARNVCALAINFHLAGFDVVIADVLDAATALTYRQHLPDALVVHPGGVATGSSAPGLHPNGLAH